MQYDKTYKGRHGLADFENNKFSITNKKDDATINCELIKVPDYTFVHKYREKIYEGNGWYSYGDTITKTITHDFYYLVVFGTRCFGVIDKNSRNEFSTKFAIENFSSKNHVRNFMLSIETKNTENSLS